MTRRRISAKYLSLEPLCFLMRFVLGTSYSYKNTTKKSETGIIIKNFLNQEIFDALD
ncbi:hypothetical protein [Paenilisteria rocourtiae]|uniref:hypothetical protein n=1 Tax=Listeria rocourtiae TaxID=647910 RepID=UPI001414F733|nr:hypothetical protein [Listeria rocourtiae]MBC1436025.1 hypothetical protein [Listeria rocourtiae]MBC1605237.1 hypothetical protein [Listeria rocourtiae]